MTIQAIETSYRGYRMRSRLEARWAVFFDAMGIKWTYEPQGFERTKAGTVHRYLPDFFLPDLGTWVEVKPTREALDESKELLREMCRYPSPLPGMDDSLKQGRTFGSRPGLLLLGDIPDPTQTGTYLHTIVQQGYGLLHWHRCLFVPLDDPARASLHIIHGCDFLLGMFRAIPGGDQSAGQCVSPEAFHLPTPVYFPQAIEAYAVARGARFEHGERTAA
jgi:hypothetical protein